MTSDDALIVRPAGRFNRAVTVRSFPVHDAWRETLNVGHYWTDPIAGLDAEGDPQVELFLWNAVGFLPADVAAEVVPAMTRISELGWKLQIRVRIHPVRNEEHLGFMQAFPPTEAACAELASWSSGRVLPRSLNYLR